MHNILVPNGATSGPGGTTVVESVSVVTIANSLTSGDLGKPVALANGAQTVSVWDDTSSSVTPIGILTARDATSITIATEGDVINIPSSLIDSISGGVPTAGRYYYWDLSAIKYVTAVPGDVTESREIFEWLSDNGDGTHRVSLLGYRPYDTSLSVRPRSITATIDAPAAGQATGNIVVPIACTIVGYKMLAVGITGTTTVDVWKAASAVPTVANTIVASAPISGSAVFTDSTTLTGWTTSVAENDVIKFSVTATGGATNLVIVLDMIEA